MLYDDSQNENSHYTCKGSVFNGDNGRTHRFLCGHFKLTSGQVRRVNKLLVERVI